MVIKEGIFNELSTFYSDFVVSFSCSILAFPDIFHYAPFFPNFIHTALRPSSGILLAVYNDVYTLIQHVVVWIQNTTTYGEGMTLCSLKMGVGSLDEASFE